MNTYNRIWSLALLTLAVGTSASSGRGQCGPAWISGTGVPGVAGIVNAVTTWDPDGAGPLGELVVVGGEFDRAGDILADNIAAYDPQTGAWSPLGLGVNREVVALVVLANGDLAAAGRFSTAGGQSADYLATWDGGTWSGTGLSLPFAQSPIRDLAVMPNGDLVIGGSFTSVNGIATNGVASWDGAIWSVMPGFVSGGVYDLLVRSNGELVASGSGGIYLWTGSTWQRFGQMIGLSGSTSGPADMLNLPTGELLVGGNFSYADGVLAQGTAVWDGSTWASFATAPPPTVAVRTLGLLPSGEVLIGGSGDFDPLSDTNNLARWDGSSWQSIGGGMKRDYARVWAFASLPSGAVFVGGLFDQVGDAGVSAIAFWDGAAWNATNAGTNGGELRLIEQQDGDAIACGYFSSIGGFTARSVARWDGFTWSPLGDSSLSGGITRSACTLDNGDVILIGSFGLIGGVSTGNIARYDGVGWNALSGGMTFFGQSRANTIVPLEDDQFVLGGNFTVLRGVAAPRVVQWDGTDWKAMGSGFGDGAVESLLRMPSGDLLAAGSMTVSGSVNVAYLARWDGAQWQRFAGGANGAIRVTRVLANGDLLAVGDFTSIGGASGSGGVAAPGIARWDGSSWTAVGLAGLGMPVTSVVELPNGDLVFGGLDSTAGGYQANHIAVWDGTAWSDIDAGLDGDVAGMAYVARTGEVVVAGEFVTAGGEVSSQLARFGSGCPSNATAVGTGCSGSGGANVLAVESLPWLGASYRYRASGMPANGLALDVRGLTASGLPLSGILPEALPGCDLLVTPVLVELALPLAGELLVEWAIPNTTSLVGVQVRNQVVALGFDALGALSEVTSSNALLATIGSY